MAIAWRKENERRVEAVDLEKWVTLRLFPGQFPTGVFAYGMFYRADTPPRETWALYGYWCFRQLIANVPVIFDSKPLPNVEGGMLDRIVVLQNPSWIAVQGVDLDPYVDANINRWVGPGMLEIYTLEQVT